jgi:hypothetical protein
MRNVFSRNLYLQKGAVQIINTTSFTDQASLYSGNAGFSGSALYMENT